MEAGHSSRSACAAEVGEVEAGLGDHPALVPALIQRQLVAPTFHICHECDGIHSQDFIWPGIQTSKKYYIHTSALGFVVSDKNVNCALLLQELYVFTLNSRRRSRAAHR